ncbi:MAG: rod shape-determining protein RodA [Treponema sp.]|nr:rod shape-determining protein RodA [Treponema sp.]
MVTGHTVIGNRYGININAGAEVKIRDIFEFDFILFAAVIILTFIGILTIRSAGINSEGVLTSNEYKKQIIWGIIGTVSAVTVSFINVKYIYNASPFLYAATILLLLYTLVGGKVVNSARSWLGFSDLGIQPSEFAKITTILFLSRYLISTQNKVESVRRFLVSSAIALLPMALVLLQPDFGTSLVFIPIFIIVCFVGGVSLKYILFIIACIALTAFLTFVPIWQSYIIKKTIPIFTIINDNRFTMILLIGLSLVALLAAFSWIQYKRARFFWILYTAAILIFSFGVSKIAQKILKEYQKMRLIVFLDPDVDPLGAGWNINQSITAIGSGGISGKGYLQGTQSHYRFIPQQSTDFIFSIFAEEWGFIGTVTIFALFFIVCFRLIRIMQKTANEFGCYISAGMVALLVFHFFINVGMTMGIMPITGIPLPLISYGGSATISTLLGIGFALNGYIYRIERDR